MPAGPLSHRNSQCLINPGSLPQRLGARVEQKRARQAVLTNRDIGFGWRLRTGAAGMLGLVGGSGGGGGVGEFFVFADYGDKGLGGAREAAVAAVDETEFAPEVDAFHVEELYFAGFYLIAGEALADEGDAGVGGDEALDHADAGKLHDDAQAGSVGAEKFVEDLASEAGAREDQRLAGDFFERDLGAMRERIAGADHEAEAVSREVMNFKRRRFNGESDDADVNGAVFDALQDLVAEIAIDADVDLRIAALEFGEYVGEKIEASGFVGAEDKRALHDVAAVGNDLNGFVAETEKTFGVFEEDFAGGSQLDGFSGTVEEAGAIGLFELADLGADGGLGAENFLAGAREAF